MRTKYQVNFNRKAAIFVLAVGAAVVASVAYAALHTIAKTDTAIILAETEPSNSPVESPKPSEKCPDGETGTPSNCIKPEPLVLPPQANKCMPQSKLNVETNRCEYENGWPAVNPDLIPTGAAGFDDIRLEATEEPPTSSPDDKGAVRIVCEFSHMNFDDAIMYPGQQGKAHLHAYFGNADANYLSTPESIRTTGKSTCTGGIMNRSAYWMPAIIDDATGAPVKPRITQAYYKHGVVQEIPRGLRMISGDMRRTKPVHPSMRYQWFECDEVYKKHENNLVSCDNGHELTMVVAFPSCWDGKNLDSPNHQDHMAFEINGRCPGSHPKHLPIVTMKTYYPVKMVTGTSTWRLSSDNYAKNGQNAGYSSHADFMMGWDETLHKVLIDNCINKAKDCHSHLTGDGRKFY